MWMLDGYNCIKRSALWGAHDSLDKARAHLAALCNDLCRRHRLKDRDIVIVFDGQGGGGAAGHRDGFVRVVFACGMSADAYIKQHVETAARPACIRVVTDDKAVGYYVRALGAAWVSVKEFFNRTNPSSGTKSFFGRTTDKNIAPDQLAVINEELRRLWVDNRGREE